MPENNAAGSPAQRPVESCDDTPTNAQSLPTLLSAKPVIINVGLEGFAEELRDNGAEVLQVDWQPPASGDSRLADLLSRLG